MNTLTKHFRFLKVTGTVLLSLVFFTGYGVFAQTLQQQTVNLTYPGLSKGILGGALLEDMDTEELVKADDWKITRDELTEIVHGQDPGMTKQLEKNLFFVLEQEALSRVLANEARKAGIADDHETKEQFIRKLFDKKTAEVIISDDEIRAFYEANREMVGGASFESVADGIQQYLLQEKKQQEFAAYLSATTASLQLRINESWVERQNSLAADNPVDQARRSSKPTMVEFGATGCIPCDMMQPILDKLEKNYGDRLNIVFVHVGEEQILAARYGIRSIPVQVFFDAEGREVFRHTGFFAEEELIGQLTQMGVAE